MKDNQMTWVTSESSYRDRKSYKNFIKGQSPPPNGKPGNLTCVEQWADSNTDITGNQKEGLWSTSTHCGEQKARFFTLAGHCTSVQFSKAPPDYAARDPVLPNLSESL